MSSSCAHSLRRPGEQGGMGAQVMVLAPAPRLTVTIETRGTAPDIHLHAGGQGVWQARMVRAMRVPTVLCAAFGGESGRVVRCLLDDDEFDLRAVAGPARTRGGGPHPPRRRPPGPCAAAPAHRPPPRGRPT